MTWYPTIKLFASNGSTLVYTFEHVLDLPDWPNDNPSSIVLDNLRSQGAIVLPGGNKAYKLTLKGVLSKADYNALIIAMASIKSSIVANTPYVLKIDTSISTTDNINVKRILPISWEGPTRKTKIQYYTIEFLAGCW
jgi:hypothetical protein